MEFLSCIIKENMNLPCFFPANFEKCEVKTNKHSNIKNELLFPYEIDFDTSANINLNFFFFF
jgi:hypothetical protein